VFTHHRILVMIIRIGTTVCRTKIGASSFLCSQQSRTRRVADVHKSCAEDFYQRSADDVITRVPERVCGASIRLEWDPRTAYTVQFPNQMLKRNDLTLAGFEPAFSS
jgi:hypothetical protein